MKTFINKNCNSEKDTYNNDKLRFILMIYICHILIMHVYICYIYMYVHMLMWIYLLYNCLKSTNEPYSEYIKNT